MVILNFCMEHKAMKDVNIPYSITMGKIVSLTVLDELEEFRSEINLMIFGGSLLFSWTQRNDPPF